MQSRNIVPTLWFLVGFSGLLLILGLFKSDPLAMLVGTCIGGIFLCFFVPFLSACYIDRRPWPTVLSTVLVIIGVLYANAWACKSAGTRDIHPIDHGYMLWFCLPGVLWMLLGWRKR